jgi:hypothetical protein
MGETVRFHETLRRLAMLDEPFVERQAGLGLGLAGTPALDPRTAALVQPGVSGKGPPSVGLPQARGGVALGCPSDGTLPGLPQRRLELPGGDVVHRPTSVPGRRRNGRRSFSSARWSR